MRRNEGSRGSKDEDVGQCRLLLDVTVHLALSSLQQLGQCVCADSGVNRSVCVCAHQVCFFFVCVHLCNNGVCVCVL